jgi:murein L,D-transpeptidase YafK
MTTSPLAILRGIVFSCVAAVILAQAGAAAAIPLDAKEVNAIRSERKKAASNGKLPLPGTPDLSRLQERLDKRGLPEEAAIFIRIFKAESELEVWMSRPTGSQYTLFASYPICYWSGNLGPKLKEGDRQAPEGFYTVTQPQTTPNGPRWPKALDIGFPNAFDKVHARTGSYILIHGGCASIGCFAMTNGVHKELHRLAVRALEAGQTYVPVHVFPFRMTQNNLARFETPELRPFWRNLKEGYDVFERTRRPPRVSICGKRYSFAPVDKQEADNPGPIAVCPRTQLAIKELADINARVAKPDVAPKPAVSAATALATAYLDRPAPTTAAGRDFNGEQSVAPRPLPPETSPLLTRPLACSLALAGCRNYEALRERLVQKLSRSYVAERKQHAAN